MKHRSHDSRDRRAQLEQETKAFIARGGAVHQAPPGRRNPLNEDKHNNFLFLGRKR